MRHLILVLIGLLVVGGCNGGDETASNTAPPNAAAGVGGMGSAAGVDMGDGGYDEGYDGGEGDEGYEDGGEGYDDYGTSDEDYPDEGSMEEGYSDYDSGYDGGYDGNPGPDDGYSSGAGDGNVDYSGYPDESGGPTGGQQQAAGGGLLGSLGLGALFGGGASNNAGGPTLAEAAQQAFQRGRDKDAMNLWYASILTGEERGTEMLKTMQWIDEFKQPALAVRFGIGITYSAPRIYRGGPMPIGTRQNLPIRGATGGNTYGSDGASTGAGVGHRGVAEYAGELGDALIVALKDRIDAGDFGVLLKEAAAGATVRPGNQSGAFAGYDSGGYDSGGYGNEGYDVGGYGNEGYDAGYSYDAGMESGAGYEDYGSSDAGYEDYGSSGPGYSGDVGYPGASGPGGQASNVQLPDPGAEQILPGISFLGRKERAKLLEQAKEQNLQILLVFDVQVASPAPNPKTGIVTTNTSVDLYDVQTGKKIHATQQLSNVTVQLTRESPRFQRKNDPVDVMVEGIVTAIDERIKLKPMPAGLNPQNTLNRVTSLVSSQYENPLPVLTEIRYYNSRELLTDELLRKAYEHMLGKDAGKSLAEGSASKKQEAIQQWIPVH